MIDFLGHGLLTPFRWDGKTDFANGGGDRLVHSALTQVLGIRAGTGGMAGELPWRGNAGSLVFLLKHGNIRILQEEAAKVYVQDAVRKWEPRAKILNVSSLDAKNNASRNRMLLKVRWQLIDVNNPRNQVILPPQEDVFSVPI